MKKVPRPLPVLIGLLLAVGAPAGENRDGFDSTQLYIGAEPQLFVDNWIIESVQGITRRWHISPSRLPLEAG